MLATHSNAIIMSVERLLSANGTSGVKATTPTTAAPTGNARSVAQEAGDLFLTTNADITAVLIVTTPTMTMTCTHLRLRVLEELSIAKSQK
jgi:hypothetical protein